MVKRNRLDEWPLGRLPETCCIGRDVRIFASEVAIGAGVRIGDGVCIVGNRVHIGSDVHLDAGSDLRAGDIAIGTGTELGRNVRVLCADRFALGRAARFADGVDVTCRAFSAGSLLYVGHGTVVGYGGTYESTALVTIGDRVTIGPLNILNANHEIQIGSDVGSGAYVSIWTHGYHFGHRLLDGYSYDYRHVRVGARVWLGYHCTILPGVEIGEACIVAAGAMVTRTFPHHRLLAGVPAIDRAVMEDQPLSADQALISVRAVIERWVAEAAWKGISVQAGATDSWLVQLGGRRWRLELTRELRFVYAGRREGEPQRIIVAIDGDPERRPAPGEALFILRLGALTGEIDEVVEDLRDWLRRHAMPCGSATTYRSLVPIPFQQLLSVADPTVASPQNNRAPGSSSELGYET